MDDKHQFDIESNMRVPNRISMSGDKGHGASSYYNIRDGMDDLVNHRGSYSMDIPQRILVGGGDSHVLVKHETVQPSGVVVEDELYPNIATGRSNWPEKNVLIETPPTSMILTKVHYPDIGETILEKQQRRNSIEDADPLSSLHRRVENIQRKMDSMERREEARKKREWLMIGSVGLIVFMKLFSTLFGRNS